ncbi:carboxylesterase/lipase family protein [Pseudomaricurvus sp. HS19]|uniref:carboxylesterase/lipase family protein n=1 Tax=Pseudomaricurvus sp. HS19 TaxID=2692626 RepID=UPI00136D625C|nr:carboxylesterase family protein [Pseudomaricurvus sp. HS19]MYM64167.1 carboxylesterase family protein [Pseudomaricurvus sp. HS19]
MKKAALLLLALVAGLLIYRHVSAPSADPATLRQLQSGAVVGFEDQENTYAWKGIPFAAPPVDTLRWQAPRPVASWEGTREALEHGAMCSQVVAFDWMPVHPVIGSEDCLYLDVWSPRLSAGQVRTSNRPVMVYIHGGANTMGMSGAFKQFRLAGREDVIVVALQYRLGLLGWFSHPALRSQAPTPLDGSGNFAVQDMVMALQWVQKNIRAFGGNPDNVTIFGESAGGMNTVALLASPLAKGLFHKAIVQSGNIQTVPLSQAEHYLDDADPGLPYSSREFINRLLIADGRAADRAAAKTVQNGMSDSELVSWLRGKSPKELLGNAELRNLLGYQTYSNVRDGLVLPDKPLLELFADPADYNAVPVIVGSNLNEYKFFLWQLDRFADKRFGFLGQFLGYFPIIKDADDYNRLTGYFSDQWRVTGVNEPASVLAASQPGEIFTYRLDWARQKGAHGVDMSELFGSAHGNDVVFLLGTDAVSSLPTYAQAQDENDYEVLGNLMRGYWAEFARTGKPGQGGDTSLPEWQPWQAEGANKMLLDLPGKGLGMAVDRLTVAELKQRLRDDPKIASTRERCELYTQLFWYALTKDFWDDEEYRALGCEAWPRESFSGLI